MNSPLAHPSVRLAAAVLLLAAVSCGGGGGSSRPTSETYTIQLTYVTSTLTAGQKAVFAAAADRIEGMVTHGLTIWAAGDFAGKKCSRFEGDPQAIPITEGVNGGLLIFVEVTHIDGIGGILGQSGPCWVRPGTAGLPVIGLMSFDEDDFAALASNGTLPTVVLHEMLHVVGFGTVWIDRPGLLVGAAQHPATPHSPTFTGAAAVTALHGIGGPGFSAVPVEGCSTPGTPTGCGEGTADSHWTETVFQSELMTGWIGWNGDTSTIPLSPVTLASLADLGYQVDMSTADDYSLPPQALHSDRASSGVEPIHLLHDTIELTPSVMPGE